MASVQELIAAAEAQKSPFVRMLEGAAGGYINGQNTALEREKNRIAIEMAKQQMEQQRQDQIRQEENRRNIEKSYAADMEKQRTQALNSSGEKPDGVFPQQKLTTIYERDSKGNLSSKQSFSPTQEEDDLKSLRKDLLSAQIDATRGRADRGERQFDVKVSNDLRKEFINREEVKDYVKVVTGVKTMDALLKKAINGDDQSRIAIDQGLITLYNKMTDPTSVVRESEYARTPENVPIINRMFGAIDKLKSGGAGLTNADREALVIGAKIVANERGKAFQDRRNEYVALADKLSADPNVVVGTIPSFSGFDIGGSSSSVPTIESGQQKKAVGRWNPKTGKVEFF